MSRLKVIGLLAVLLAFNSCVEQITFPLEKPETERLIVSGTFTDLDEKHTVLLSETTSKARQPLFSGGYFTLDDKPRPVQNAQVHLIAPEVNGRWLYREVKPGQYELDGDYAIREGLTYFLEIQVANKTYRSTPQQMPKVIGSDKLSYTFERARLEDNPEAALISIESEVTLPDQVGDFFLRWAVDEAYYWDLTFFPNPFNTPPPPCYVFEISNPERITLINGNLLNKPGGKSKQVVSKRLIDQSFLSRHYFNVRQLSIDKEAYEYWRKVRELVNNTGSVFDTPPASIRGNLFNVNDPEEVVLGYFEVAKANVSRIYTTRADVPFFLEEICTYVPGKRATEYKPTCLSCNAFPNSTSELPDWWFDQ